MADGMMSRGLSARIRESLFFIPMLYVVGAIVLSLLSIYVDHELFERGVVPAFLEATVASARALLGTIAGATITVAAVSFSIALLLMQLAGSQYSPRVITNFFRDPVTKHTMGVAAGTFTYCLLILRVVRQPDGEAFSISPNVSAVVAIVLGTGTILAILYFISHAGHSIRASVIVRRVADQTHEEIRSSMHPAGSVVDHPAPPIPDRPGFPITSTEDGWVQQIAAERLLSLVPAGGLLLLDTHVGEFVMKDTPLGQVWPQPDDPEAFEREVRRCVSLGRSRTLQLDAAFGVRQLVDIALRALSPGINDPTTAEESIVHIGSLMRQVLLRDLPPRVLIDDDGSAVVFNRHLEHADYVALAFDQIRRAAATYPAVVATLLETLGTLVEEVERSEVPARAELLRHSARLALENVDAAQLLPADRTMLHRLARDLRLFPASLEEAHRIDAQPARGPEAHAEYRGPAQRRAPGGGA